jgi:hypothetical protein
MIHVNVIASGYILLSTMNVDYVLFVCFFDVWEHVDDETPDVDNTTGTRKPARQTQH